MRQNAWRILYLVVAITVAFFTARGPVDAQGPVAGKAVKGGKEKAKAGPFTRLPDGKPNMQGYWQTKVFFTAFDVEERGYESGLRVLDPGKSDTLRLEISLHESAEESSEE